jgi:hypothetical protein
MTADRPKSRDVVTYGEGGPASFLAPAHDRPILPIAESYTVINLVSIDVKAAGVKVPFTWKVTGWFMIGWSAEFGASEVRPLRYFGGLPRRVG